MVKRNKNTQHPADINNDSFVEEDLDNGYLESSLDIENPDSFSNTDGYSENNAPAGSVSFGDAKDRPKRKGAGNHARAAQAAYVQKSARMRKILIVVIILLLLCLCAGGFLVFKLIQTAQDAATQQTLVSTVDQDAMDDDAAKDTSSTTAKKTTVPDLVALMGLTQDEAIAKVGRGAQVSSTLEVNEEDNPIKSEVRLALTTEPADSRGGTPTVYLSLNEDGTVIQAGYSAATSSLGYGSLSFADAVNNESIVEKTLAEAGLSIPEKTVSLPTDKMEYSTYASDGTTLARENYSFEGEGQVDNQVYSWTAMLSYDYSMANATGNLSDTIRTIYVYIGI